jgi:hypothetical protein
MRSSAGIAIPLGILLLGLLVVHFGFLLGPGTQIPGSAGDTALLHFVLEHGFQWLRAGIVSRSFWDAPFFYPHHNSMAYSEVLLGLLPFYAIWRAAGVGPGVSYQIWFVSISVLNFLLLYAFLRRVMALRRLPAALGAYLFAFGSPRVNQTVHAQLWAEFYVVLATWFLILFLQLSVREARGKAVLWLSLAGAATALQLVSGYYFGWFFCFSLLIAFAVGFLARGTRRALIERARRFWPAPLVAATVVLGVAGPSLAHYKAAADELNVHDVSVRGLTMPTLGSWIYAGDNSLLYSWIRHFPKVSRVDMYWERANGIGLLTGVLVLAGAILGRRHAVWRTTLWVTVIVLVITFTVPGGWTLWRYVCRPLPGAAALRAVSRWGVFLLFPFAIALACCLDRVDGGRRWAVVALLGVVVVLEQAVEAPHYDFQMFQRVALNYARQLKPICNCFLITPDSRVQPDLVPLQVTAMWAQAISGVPTLNGYSGSFPPEYPLFAGITTGRDYMRVLEGISEWQERHSRSPLRPCWLRPDPEILTAQGAPLSLEIVSPRHSPLQHFVLWSYIGILGRRPQPDEMASAEAALDNEKESRVRFVLDLIQTPESRRRAFVEKADQALLGRDAGAEEWWFRSSQISRGAVTKEVLATGILRGAEYGKRCTLLPGGGCQPAMDAAEVVHQIDSAAFDQKEGSRLTAGLICLYLLGRPPGAREAADWTRPWSPGLAEAALVEAIFGSQEYEALTGVRADASATK